MPGKRSPEAKARRKEKQGDKEATKKPPYDEPGPMSRKDSFGMTDLTPCNYGRLQYGTIVYK